MDIYKEAFCDTDTYSKNYLKQFHEKIDFVEIWCECYKCGRNLTWESAYENIVLYDGVEMHVFFCISCYDGVVRKKEYFH